MCEMATAASAIRFSAELARPARAERSSRSTGASGTWLFLQLPKAASAKLPSRGMVSVEGTLNGARFRATLAPDGRGGHWMKVDRTLRAAARKAGAGGVEAGDTVALEIAPVPVEKESEPRVPIDVRRALSAAPKAARDTWGDITPVARRDWIQWITSGKLAQTRVKRVATACDMLAKGKRRPCCFDRSGMYSKSLECPAPG